MPYTGVLGSTGGLRLYWGPRKRNYKRGMELQERHGTTREAWNYKRGMGLQERHGTTREAWDYKRGMRLQERHETTREA